MSEVLIVSGIIVALIGWASLSYLFGCWLFDKFLKK